MDKTHKKGSVISGILKLFIAVMEFSFRITWNQVVPIQR